MKSQEYGIEIERSCLLITVCLNGFEIYREAQVQLVKPEGLDRGYVEM